MRMALGYLAPGRFSFPENPLRAASGLAGVMLEPVPFSFPQNPLALGVGCAGKCGCGGTCQRGVSGLAGVLDSPWIKYAAIGAGVLLVLGMFARGDKAGYERAMAGARDEYSQRVREIRRKYPRVGSRVASRLPF